MATTSRPAAGKATDATKGTAEQPKVVKPATQSPHLAGIKQGSTAEGVTKPVAAHSYPAVTEDDQVAAEKAEKERQRGDGKPCAEHFPDGWGADESATSVGCEHGMWTRKAPVADKG